MLGLVSNVIAVSTHSNGGWLTFIGFSLYFFYSMVVFIRLLLSTNIGKTFNMWNQFLGFAIVFTIAMLLMFFDPSNTKNIGNAILLLALWIGSLIAIRLCLGRIQQQASHK